jgi:hypothetical protein
VKRNGARKGVQIIVWMDRELVAQIEAARGPQDRSAWIRRKLGEALERGERPAFAQALESVPAPASAPQATSPAPKPSQTERKEPIRW